MFGPVSTLRPTNATYSVADIFNVVKQQLAQIDTKLAAVKGPGIATESLNFQKRDLLAAFDTVKTWQAEGVEQVHTNTILADAMYLQGGAHHQDSLVAQVASGRLAP